MTDPMTEAFRQFGQMLEALCPRHAAHRQPLALEPDAPRALVEFWLEVGFSEAVGAGGRGPREWRPTREASREWLGGVFERRFAEDVEARDIWGVERDDFSGAWTRLPARFRILYPDLTYLLISDESGSTEDPPVLKLNMNAATLEPVPESAVAHFIRDTWRRVMAERTAGVVDLPIEGDPVLAPVFSGLHHVADGIWHLDTPDPGVLPRLYYDDVERYLDFVLGQPDERLPHFFSPTGQLLTLQPTSRLDPEHVSEPGFRRFANREAGFLTRNWHHAVGRIEGMGVWLKRTEHSCSVSLVVATANVEPMRAWLRDNGLKLEFELDIQSDIWSEPVAP